MSNPIVFVDLDNTLIFTQMLNLFAFRAPEGAEMFIHGKIKAASRHRPGAHDFLTELANHYELNILTYGHSVFQTKALKALKMDGYFSNVFGIDNYGKIKRPECFVLIDDNPKSSFMAADKFRWLGREFLTMTYEQVHETFSNHYIQCKPYMGNADAPCLTEHLPDVHRMIEKQLATLARAQTP